MALEVESLCFVCPGTLVGHSGFHPHSTPSWRLRWGLTYTTRPRQTFMSGEGRETAAQILMSYSESIKRCALFLQELRKADRVFKIRETNALVNVCCLARLPTQYETRYVLLCFARVRKFGVCFIRFQ